MKLKKTLPYIFIVCFILIIAFYFFSYKYHKEKSASQPETKVTDPLTDALSNNNIITDDTVISDNQTVSDNEMISTIDSHLDNENFTKSNDISDVTDTTSVSNNDLTLTDMETNLEGDSDMINPERVIYHEGFYYEPLSDEIKDRIYGLSYKEDCTVPYEALRYVSVLYKDFDNQTATGELICNKAIAQDLVEIFYELYQNDYQIEKIRLIDEYGADDDISCQENNTSCFNYRVVAGSTNLSKHALGLAIDINPFYNPYVTYPNGIERISPPGSEPYANRDANLPHMIQKGDLIYNLFIERGFTWGGEWKSLKDYQHFQKVID